MTVCPTGLRPPKTWAAVVDPSTTTEAALLSSAAVMKRPLETVRARTPSHCGVVPTALVVQFDVPATRVTDVDTDGATAATSGATSFDPNASASAFVNVDA